MLLPDDTQSVNFARGMHLFVNTGGAIHSKG